MAAESDEAGPNDAFDTFEDPELVPIELNLIAIMERAATTMIRKRIFFNVFAFFFGSQQSEEQQQSDLEYVLLGDSMVLSV